MHLHCDGRCARRVDRYRSGSGADVSTNGPDVQLDFERHDAWSNRDGI